MPLLSDALGQQVDRSASPSQPAAPRRAAQREKKLKAGQSPATRNRCRAAVISLMFHWHFATHTPSGGSKSHVLAVANFAQPRSNRAAQRRSNAPSMPPLRSGEACGGGMGGGGSGAEEWPSFTR